MLSRFIPRTILATYLVSRCPRQTLVSRLMLSSRPVSANTRPDVYTVCSWCVTPSQLRQLQTTEGNPSRRQIDRTSLSSSRRRRKRDLEEIIDRSWTAVVVAFPSPPRGTIYIYLYSIVGIVGFRRKGKKRFRRKESFFIRRHSKSFDRSPIFFKRITGRSSLLLTGLKAVPQDPRSSIEVESKAIFFPRRRRRVYNQPHRQIKSFARRLLQRDSSIYPFLPSLFSPPSPSLLFSIAMERSAEPDAKGKIRVTPRNDTGTVHRRENNIRFAPRPDFAIQKESAHIISSWTIARVLVKLYVYTCVCIKKK